MKKWFQLLAKFIISAGLLWYLLSNTELSAVSNSLKSVEPIWLVLAFVLLVVGKFLTGYRWQRLLAAHQIHIPLWLLMISLYVGQFFNNFLPSTVGGDTVRAYDTASYSKQSTNSITTVFVDRLIGVFALVFLALLAVVIGFWLQADVISFVLPVIGIFLLSAFSLIFVFNTTLVSWFNKLIGGVGLAKLVKKVSQISQSFQALKDKPSVLINAFFTSIVLQVNVILFYYSIARSIDLDVALFFFFIIIPIALIIELIPISINGIGLRESAYVFLLARLGAPSQDAIALAWLAFGLILTQGIVGGIIFAFRDINLRRFTSRRTLVVGGIGLLFLSLIIFPLIYVYN